MFEVKWSGSEGTAAPAPATPSPQVEQAMVTRYLELLRESDVLNKMRCA
jgi:hypothetical protein